MTNKVFITVSDIHHGAKNADEYRNEFYSHEESLMSVFYELLEEEEFLGIFITGDYYDSKLSLEDKRSKLASAIILDIFQQCKEYNKYFIILKGTASHDHRQLDNFKNLELSYDKFRIVNTVEVLDIDGLKTLCIPEEYVVDSNEYYSKFLSDKYDLILGHGMFNYNAFEENSAERSMPSMPIFDENVFVKISPLTIFGHIHTHSSYKDKIYYNGSYSRLCYGEEGPKGFLLTNYEDRNNIDVVFIENQFAPQYVTYELDELVNIVNAKELDIKMIIDLIEEIAATKHVRIKVSSAIINKFPSEIEFIKSYFKSKANVKIHLMSRLYSTDKISEIEDKDEKHNKYEFLLNGSDSSIYEKIKEYLKFEYNIVFDIDYIKKLTSP
jgi:hypothetical protein